VAVTESFESCLFQTALPILGVSSSAAAEEFYCGKLGFRRAYVHRPDPEREDPCWMGVIRDGAHLVLSSFEGDGPPGSRGTQIMIADAAAVQREFREAGVEAGDELRDQTWGHLEFNVRDPDGNLLNFAQDKGG
jgi:catechol 2,3-dioxygenase-like lactoylglutathione lyase family enzyme